MRSLLNCVQIWYARALVDRLLPGCNLYSAPRQVVLDDRRDSGPYAVNPKLSITRIGTRAYHKAIEALAPQVRLDLAQAEDARK